MPNANIEIKQDITKRVKKFITKDGQIVDKSEMGNYLGGIGKSNGELPPFQGDKKTS